MHSQPSNTAINYFKKALDKAYGKILFRRRLSILLICSSLVVLGWLILGFIEQRFFLEASDKSLYFGLVTLITLIIGYRKYKALPSSTQKNSFITHFAYSTQLENIRYLLDLEDDTQADPLLVQAAIEQNLSTVNRSDFNNSLEHYVQEQPISKTYTRGATVLGVLALCMLGSIFLIGDGLKRSALFWKNFEAPNPYSYSISPQNITLEQGNEFIAIITFEGNQIPEQVSLMVKTDVERSFRPIAMNDRANGQFNSAPINLNNSLSYYVAMGEFQSEIYTATVQLRPRFQNLTANQYPPSYTRLDSTVESYPFSVLSAYQGSEIVIEGLLNKDVEQVQLRNTKDELLKELDGNSFSHTIAVAEPDTLFFMMKDEDGLTNKNEFRFIIDPLIDQYPIAEIIDPATDIEVVDPKELPLLYKASDDFDLSQAELHYQVKKAYVEAINTQKIALTRPENAVLQNYNWDLSRLNLSPLDELTFWIEITDNDGYSGYKTSRSRSITLKVPSVIDYFESLDEKEEDIQSDLEDISESFQEVNDIYEEFKESLKEDAQADYQEEEQLQRAQEKQEELQKKIDDLNKAFEQIKDELSENNMLSEETQKAYDELKNLMEEIDDPALREALEKLRENLSQMTPDQLRRAMEEVEFNEEDYKKRLQRTMELFKRLKLLADLEKLKKSFEDQARQESELDDTQSANDDYFNKRKADLNQIEKLQEAIQKLGDYTSKQNESVVSDYQQATTNTLDQEVAQPIQKEIQEFENTELKDSPFSYQEPYDSLAAKTTALIELLNKEEEEVNVAALQYLLYSLLNLSLEQEDLVLMAQEAEDRSLAYVEFAREQRNVADIFKVLADSLFEVSKAIPQFSNQINQKAIELKGELDRSLKQMAERNQRNSSVASRQAYAGINEIATLIAQLLEQLQNQQNGGEGSGSGSPQNMQQLLEQMGEMKGNQQQLNQQIQDLINDIQGDRLSNEQMDRLDQIARQQNEIRKQLQQMLQQGDLQGDKIGSDLQRMIEEMEDTINDLRGGAADPTLVKRQQNILNKMLESEKALQEREEEDDEREGTNPTNLQRATPPEMTLEELEKQIRSRLNDPNFTKYAPDYQRLIERYFDLLKKLRDQNIQF